jgi:hypothetical protein
LPVGELTAVVSAVSLVVGTAAGVSGVDAPPAGFSGDNGNGRDGVNGGRGAVVSGTLGSESEPVCGVSVGDGVALGEGGRPIPYIFVN